MKEAKSQTINLCRGLPRQGRGRGGGGVGGGERGDGVHLVGEANCFFACSSPGLCPVGGWGVGGGHQERVASW